MSGRNVTLHELHTEWSQEPAYVAEYEALASEFALAHALIEARMSAHITQEDVAAKMGTSRTIIARLEGGRTAPSTRVLQRFAEATGSKLRISFERLEKEGDRRRS